MGVFIHLLEEGRSSLGDAKIDGMGEIMIIKMVGEKEKEEAGVVSDLWVEVGMWWLLASTSLTVLQQWEKAYMGEILEIWDLWTAWLLLLPPVGVC